MSGTRITSGLMVDVWEVLERHGFTLPDDQQRRHRALGESLSALARLVEAFEGREGAA